MISWIVKLCVLCSMSALTQMVVGKASRDALRMICGMLMLHMTCESAGALLAQMSSGGSLMELFTLLIK